MSFGLISNPLGRTSSSSSSGGGTGTVTVVGAGSLTSTALVTGGGSQTIQTAAATATMDSSGNISTPGAVTTGAGGSVAGSVGLGQGTAPSTGTTNIKIAAPAAVTSYIRILPGTVGSTGYVKETVSGSTQTESLVTSIPASDVSGIYAANLGTFASPNTAAGAITWTAAVYNIYTSAGSTRTYTLPAASSYAGQGFILNVAVGTGHVNVQPASGAQLVLAGVLLTADHYVQAATSAPGNFICFISDGTNWTSLGSSGTWADSASA